MDLTGFKYERLGLMATPAALLEKLNCDPVSAQAYRHLANSDEVSHNLALKRKILISLQTRLTEQTPISTAEGLRRRSFAVFARYGYSPGLSFIWLLASVVCSTALLRYHGAFVHLKANPAETIDTWAQAAAFSLDSLLPFSLLGIAAQWYAAPSRWDDWIWITSFILLKLASWGFAILVVASITGIVRKD